MSTTTVYVPPVTRPMQHAVDVTRTLLGLPASFDNMGGGIGAVVVPVPARLGEDFGQREVLIGDTEGLLSYYDSSLQTVETFMVCAYLDQEPRHSEEVPAGADPQTLAAAVRRAYAAAVSAR